MDPGDSAGWDAIVVGSGFASSFFLLEYLRAAPANARILVLERGRRFSHAWQVEHRRHSDVDPESTYRRLGRPDKVWNFTIAVGGGSNSWWACTPRFLPEDFRLRSLHGVGRDWPVSYDDLEEHYGLAERTMSVSGPERTPYPRSTPYPQPPHRLSGPDRLLAAAYPDQWIAQPCARSRVPGAGRAVCCSNGVCHLCPVDAKFRIPDGLSEVFSDPRVTLQEGAEVVSVSTRGSVATDVVFRAEGGERRVRGDLIALGANALFNPAILMRSGLDHPILGRRLHEQVGFHVWVDLAGLRSFDGSTAITGHGYMLYAGVERRSAGACLVEGWNQPERLRWEPGRSRELLHLKCLVEDLPDERNRVELDPDDPLLPVAAFTEYSAYAYRGIDRVEARLPELLSPLPVEAIDVDRRHLGTESHLLGTTVMGDDPADSIVDRHLVHHTVRNLVVLGSGAFPTGSPANPTLTLCALSAWSARRLTASRSA